MDFIGGFLILAMFLGYGIYITIRYNNLKNNSIELINSLIETLNEKEDELEKMRRLP